MYYFLAGLLVLLLLYFSARAFANMNVRTLVKVLTRVGFFTTLLSAIGMAALGRVGLAGPLFLFAMFLLPRLGWSIGPAGPFRSKKTAGQHTNINTDFLEMTLDHDTGSVDGRITRGVFQGRDLSSLSLGEVLDFYRTCRQDDPDSAQLLEAYLDRVEPEWRERAGVGGTGSGRAWQPGEMNPDEAYEILGLKPGASHKEIRQAHRDLMKRLHPDHGGTAYLAAKINQAKEVLLGS